MLTRRQRVIFLSLIVIAAAFRVAIIHWLPNDSADDGHVYAQFARNLLEHRVYSPATEAPFDPSFVRLPGYPLFLAAIYSVFGHTNDTAVRIVQALIDTGTCVLVAVLAFLWQPDERRKIATAIAALALAAVNPFTTIYAATILTEVPTMFLSVAAIVAATMAFRAEKFERELRWWSIVGLLAGVGVMFRPDSGLLAGVIGVLLVSRGIWSAVASEARPRFASSTGASAVGTDPKRRRRFALPAHSKLSRTLVGGAVFTGAFVLALAPWTIRNWRTFHTFQPLAPVHVNMPDEFAPLGYERWLKTWVDSGELIDDLWWELNKQQIDIDELPDSAFDSQAEHDRVSDLFDQYNGSPDQEDESDKDDAEPDSSPSPTPNRKPAPANNASAKNANKDNPEKDDEDKQDQQDKESSADQPSKPGEMTPEIDAAFGQIANERIARHPFRYYVLLPAKRAHAMWFNTHSDFYPFSGDALPFNNPENSRQQNFWLPVLALLVGIYTVLGVAGFVLLLINGSFNARAWALMVALIFLTRLALASTAVSVEPRYLVEFFPFLSALGGIAIIEMLRRLRRSPVESKARVAP